MRGADYEVGERLVLVSFQGNEWPVEVAGHNSLEHDLVVRWLGKRPDLTPGGLSTVCLDHLREVRRD